MAKYKIEKVENNGVVYFSIKSKSKFWFWNFEDVSFTFEEAETKVKELSLQTPSKRTLIKEYEF